MRQSSLRVAAQEDRESELLLRLGALGRPLDGKLQPSNGFADGLPLERERPEVECDVCGSIALCDRAGHRRELHDSIVGSPGKDERMDKEWARDVDRVSAGEGRVQMCDGL